MRRPLLLTGGPAVGKTTTGRLLAAARPLGALVDVDDLRHLVIGGHRAPWDGAQGLAQQQLGVDNACTLTSAFLAAGIEVVITDIATEQSLQRYRAALPSLLVVRLTVSLDQAYARARTRPVWLRDQEFRQLHDRDQQTPVAADLVLDVDELSEQAQYDAVERTWAEAG